MQGDLSSTDTGDNAVLPMPLVERDQLNTVASRALGAFWLAFFSLYTLRALLVAPEEALGKIGPRAAVTLVGAALSWAMYRVIERLPASTPRARIAWAIGASVPTAILFAIGDAFGGGVIKPDLSLWCPHSATCAWSDVWALEVDNTIVWTFVFSAWGLLYLMLRASAETRAADRRAYAERQAARVAEIRALRYQVNPHFLYNCLNSLNALVRRKDISQAEDMIGELGQFIRFSLTVDPIADVSLDSEIEMQRRYLDLERRRFPDRMTLDVEVDPVAGAALVPPLILQPLIENAVKHGVDTTGGAVTIRIVARLIDGGFVQLIVGNDGNVSPRNHPTDGLGIGLQNVSSRLAARFGQAASFTAGPAGDHGYRVELRFPIEKPAG